LRIKEFNRNFSKEFSQTVYDLNKRGLTKLIIDIRNNPGGILGEVLTVLDMYFSPAKDRDGYFKKTRSNHRCGKNYGHRINKRRPVIIIQNRYSASGSEIFSGVLKNWGIAKIVGDTTYGKGSVQQIFNFPAEGADPEFMVKLTVSEYFVGNDTVKINRVGVSPHYLVPDSSVEEDSTLVPPNRAKINLKNDGQLRKAYELLKE